MLEKHRKMSPNTYQKIALVLLVLCIVSPIESRYENKERKQEKSIGSQQGTQPQLTIQKTVLSLCRKDRRDSFLCHCTPDDESIKAQKGLFLIEFTLLFFFAVFFFFKFDMKCKIKVENFNLFMATGRG